MYAYIILFFKASRASFRVWNKAPNFDGTALRVYVYWSNALGRLLYCLHGTVCWRTVKQLLAAWWTCLPDSQLHASVLMGGKLAVAAWDLQGIGTSMKEASGAEGFHVWVHKSNIFGS